MLWIHLTLPDVREAMDHYDLDLVDYGILIYHPVTTELDSIEANTHVIMEALAAHGQDIIVIESNNDWGSEKIRQAYASYQSNPKFHFFPSMRFEYFLAILRNAKFMIGNSSAGIREAPHYGVPTINLGTRQHNRVRSPLVLNTEISRDAISESLEKAAGVERVPEKNFGDGRSVERFVEILQNSERWSAHIQKQFVDRPSQDGKEKK